MPYPAVDGGGAWLPVEHWQDAGSGAAFRRRVDLPASGGAG